ncbi:hypothetical protein [Parasitella parasitica]|uniref:Uncharacterized protein n=1 Tax=Parasitella parasitica TaxID=35722 RepID=A0A0B7MNE1_9FUNG|nr:hypothetical protein [Parasitella parasitica]
MKKVEEYLTSAKFLERLQEYKEEAYRNCSFELHKEGQIYKVIIEGEKINLEISLRKNAQAVTMEEITDSIHPVNFDLIKMENGAKDEPDEPDVNWLKQKFRYFHTRPKATGSTIYMADFTWAATRAQIKSLHLSCVNFSSMSIFGGNKVNADEGIPLSTVGTTHLSELKFENCLFSSQVLARLLKETFEKVDKLIFEGCVFLSDYPRKLEIKFDHTEVGSLQFWRPCIRDGRSRLFLLSKKIHNQPVIYPQSVQKNALSIHAATAIQGIDPGLVTMASGIYTSPITLINSIKRYQGAPQSAEDDKTNTFKLTARFIDKACLKQYNIHSNHKRVQRRRVTRRIRLKKFYQKHCSRHKTKLNGRSVVTFVGDWSGVSTFVKGHTRRSTKPYYKQLSAPENDHLVVVDEFASTITCNSCFSRNQKQFCRLPSGKIRRVPGAVYCINPQCPRRLNSNATTTNRDRNGAMNTTLVGFSSLISEDGHSLPPFQRSYNLNKQV